MKVLDRIALVVFSVMMLIIAILVNITIFGWINSTTLYMLITHMIADDTTCKILLGINIIFIVLAIKAIFFESGDKDSKNYNDGILLENDDGKLLITKETITSMVDVVVSGFASVKSSQSKVVLDNENNLSIILTIETTSDTIIKELSNNLQIRIKEKIKESLDLDVKNIDIRVKNIVESKNDETKA